MYKSSTEIKVGIFVLLAITVFAFMAVRLGGFRIGPKEAYTITAVFPNAGGLKPGVAVEVAGIPVGNVTGIELFDNNRAKITMAIQDGIKLPADSAAYIRAQGILGDKYIELMPSGRTVEGDELQDGGAISNTQVAADMTELMSKLGAVADDLKELTGALSENNGGQEMREIITNLRNMSAKLDTIVTDNATGFQETLTNLNKTMTNLEKITTRIEDGQGSLGQLINSKKTIDELNASLEEVRQIAGKINSGQGTIGRLVNDETTIDKIDDALTGINDYLEKDKKFKVYVDYHMDYLTRHEFMKSTLNIKLQPAPDRYYLLGVTNDYFGKYSRTDHLDTDAWGRQYSYTEEEWDRNKLKFNAQIARRYYDLVLRGGLIESGAGFGADYYMLDDTLKLSFEAFSADFDHNPHLRVTGSYNIWKIFYLTAGFDDFISDQHRYSPFIGIGIQFNDDDLKYLLSGAGSAL